MSDIKKEDKEYWEKTYNCFFVQFIYDINLVEFNDVEFIKSIIDIDVVYGNGIATLPQLYLFKKQDRSIKTILHVHENVDGFKKIQEVFVDNLNDAFQSVNEFLTVCRWQILELQRYGIKLNKITYVPESIDVNLLQSIVLSKPPIDNTSKIKVIGCGKGESRKGIDRFIEISKQFDNQMYEFIWIGDVEIVNNQVILNGFGVFDDYKLDVGNVKFIGQVDTPAYLFNNADIFLMLSRQDPCPLVVLEALYMGMFVVSLKESGDAHVYCTEHDEVLETYDINNVVSSILSLTEKRKNIDVVLEKKEYYKIIHNIVSPDIISPIIINTIKNTTRICNLYNFNQFEGNNKSILWTKEKSKIEFNLAAKTLEIKISNVFNETNEVNFVFDDGEVHTLLMESSINNHDIKFDIENKKHLTIESTIKKHQYDKRDLGIYITSLKVNSIEINNDNVLIYENVEYHDQQLCKNQFNKDDKIVFACISGTSGYGVLARETVVNLRKDGYKVNYLPFNFENSINEHDEQLKIDDFDESEATCYILNFPPHIIDNVYNNLLQNKCKDKKVILFLLWESEYIKRDYINNINKFSTSVLVSSEWNKRAMIKCGVIKDIQVLHHKPILSNVCKKSEKVNFIYQNSKMFGEFKDLNITQNFYTIGQWTFRKGITDVIESFCKAFTNKDNVSLILKTYYSSYTEDDIKICITRINDILKKYQNYPTIYYVYNNLLDSDIHNIHFCGDIYISATKSEGIGLGAITASEYGKPVIITKYGAQYEYLKNDTKSKFVSYTLCPAKDDLSFELDLNNQLWSHPNIPDMVNKMKMSHKL